MSTLSGMLPAFSVFIQTGRTCQFLQTSLSGLLCQCSSRQKAKTLSGYTPLRYHRNASSFPAQTLTYMKEKNLLSQKIVAIETDYTCIPFWEETDCDYYIIPHYELIDEFAAKGIPRERLKPYGIPVRPAFSDQSDRQKPAYAAGFQSMPRFI